MEVIMRVRKSRKREYLHTLARYFLQVKPINSLFNLVILTEHGFAVRNGGAVAAVRMNEDDDIEMVFDSRASGKDILIAMSHEMIHVRQLAYGELYYVHGVPHWYSKPVIGVDYDNLPWELEAYESMIDLLRMVPVNEPASSLLN